MPYKLFKGHKLYFVRYEAYDGPITLMYCPPQTILNIMGKYIVDIAGKYYELLEVSYLDVNYKMADFVKQYPDVIGITND